jgi:hypothetical protein
MYVVSGHEGATSVTSGSRDPADRLVDLVERRSSRPWSIKVLYKTRLSPIR